MVTSTKQSLLEKYNIDPADMQIRLQWVGLTEQDFQLMRKAGEFLAADADELAKEFYEHSF